MARQKDKGFQRMDMSQAFFDKSEQELNALRTSVATTLQNDMLRYAWLFNELIDIIFKIQSLRSQNFLFQSKSFQCPPLNYTSHYSTSLLT